MTCLVSFQQRGGWTGAGSLLLPVAMLRCLAAQNSPELRLLDRQGWDSQRPQGPSLSPHGSDDNRGGGEPVKRRVGPYGKIGVSTKQKSRNPKKYEGGNRGSANSEGSYFTFDHLPTCMRL
jgi:hypothetical protein